MTLKLKQAKVLHNFFILHLCVFLSAFSFAATAANPEKEICPLDGIYTMKGVIGPPFLSSRRKRNRNNKQHGTHHHHDLLDINNSNKRHNVYSFRNTENNDQHWNLHSHIKTIRHRRSVVENKADTDTETGVLINTLKNEFNLVSTINQLNRNKRDTSNCATMANVQRTLSIGCTNENTVDVDPTCGDKADEGKYLKIINWRKEKKINFSRFFYLFTQNIPAMDRGLIIKLLISWLSMLLHPPDMVFV